MEVEKYDKKYADFTLILLSALVLIVMYVEGMLTPSLPSIAQSFNKTIDQVSLLLSVYLVSGIALSPVMGKLGDIYGKKKILSIVIIIYAVMVSVTGFSPNFTFMVISRGIQGIGLTIMPLAMSLMREQYPREMIPKAQALLSAMFGVGFAVSLPLGSLVSNDFGWRATYHTAIPFIVILAVVTIIKIRESSYRKKNVRVDAVGSAMLGISMALIVLALSEGTSWGWTSISILSMLISGFAVFVADLYYERIYQRRGGEPIFDYRLLGERNVMISNIVLSISGMGMFLAMQALTYKFETPTPYGNGLSILGTGLSLVPFALGIIIFSPLTGSIISKVGVKPIAIAGAVVAAVGFLLEGTVPDYLLTMVYEFIIGSGISMINASVINLIILTVDPKDMGLATSMNSTFRTLGSSLGAPISGIMLSLYTVTEVVKTSSGTVSFAFPDRTAFFYSFVISFAAFIAALIVTFMAKEILGKRTAGRKLTESVEIAEPAPAK